jgi:hypothetical protein
MGSLRIIVIDYTGFKDKARQPAGWTLFHEVHDSIEPAPGLQTLADHKTASKKAVLLLPHRFIEGLGVINYEFNLITVLSRRICLMPLYFLAG